MNCAKKSLKRLTRSVLENNTNATMACEFHLVPYFSLKQSLRLDAYHDYLNLVMVYVDETEKRFAKRTTYLDCFRGTNLRRTEIVCIAWLGNALSGAMLGNLRVFLYSQAGFSFQKLAIIGFVVCGLGLATIISSSLLMERFRRKTVFVGGMSTILIILL